MPIPKPNSGEKHDAFIDRCMSDEAMANEYRDEKQRLAICQSQWEESKKSAPTGTREVRVAPIEWTVTRSKDNEPRIVGYAAVFDKPSVEMGNLVEYIERGAFKGVLKRKPDVRLLFNHDENIVLGRTKSQTLRIAEDKRGLKIEGDPPDTQQARDLLVSMERGDIDQMSFSFMVGAERWDDLNENTAKRVITEVAELYDVSVVTYPAYPDTAVAVRSLTAARSAVPPADGAPAAPPAEPAENVPPKRHQPVDRDALRQRMNEAKAYCEQLAAKDARKRRFA